MSRVYLCVSIDTECDKGKDWRSKAPMGYRGIHNGITERLQPLFASFGAKPTYLLSPEIMRNEPCVEALRRVASSCELGTHLHGEYAEPGAFEPEVTKDFQRNYPPHIEQQKIKYLTDRFKCAFDRKPMSFRAGRFGIGPHTIGILEHLGYTVESSVTPHMDWGTSGAPGLAFPNAPTQPYRPDRICPGRPGSAQILEVPITIRKRWLNALPLVGSRIDPRWLRPSRGSAKALITLAENEITSAQQNAPRRPVILNAMLHNVEVVPNLSPYAASEREARGILTRLYALLSWASKQGVAVVGLGDVPEILGW
ncbi:MAG: hypothetical protein FWD73_12260 [Polyangiaceae bacterium]|nr:hypothetical protein [Polyangiaceae bacterium]